MTSAAVSSQLTYVTTTGGFGLSGVGGVLGQGNAYARSLVEAGGKIVNDFLKDAAISTVVSKEFGEVTGTLFDLAVNANELVHAFREAPPYIGGPSVDPTNPLTVAPAGNGTGTVVSYPGGIVCGSDSTACVAPFPVGETVYLDAQPNTGTFSGACSGTGAYQVIVSCRYIQPVWGWGD